MSLALIGYSGFVGSNLLNQYDFNDTYNSKNISNIKGKVYDELWCAGVQAKKWWANQNPEADLLGIRSLLNSLSTVQSKRFILISTVDVFSVPINVNENTTVITKNTHPYGLHRHMVELEILRKFDDVLIIRLPGLYGNGLKKNLIFDLIHGGNLDNFHPDSTFQFYNLNNLRRDIEIAQKAGLKLIHLTTEPVSVKEIASYCFNLKLNTNTSNTPVHYDLRTIHSTYWNNLHPYIESKSKVLTQISEYATNYTKKPNL